MSQTHEVECDRCGDRAPMRHDEYEDSYLLPKGWRMMNSQGVPMDVCSEACYLGRETRVYALENPSSSEKRERRVQELEAVLADAVALAEEGWSYASDYFKEKWNYEGELAEIRARAALSQDATDE